MQKITKKISFHNINYKPMKGDEIMPPSVAIIFMLLIVFFLICLECLLRKRVSYIVSDLNEEQEIIESRIREIIFLNPKSEIIVLCSPKTPEVLTVLTKLQNEYPQLQILT